MHPLKIMINDYEEALEIMINVYEDACMHTWIEEKWG